MRDATADTGSTEGIFAEGVTVTYRNGLTALTDASFRIPQGTITALVGVNGAGKSTLFKAIMGFVPVARGTIRLLGMPVRDALRRNLVAYVPQADLATWGCYAAPLPPTGPRSTKHWPASALPTCATARSENCPAARRSGCS